MSEEVFNEIKELVDQGQKIQAVKRYMELTDAGLKEAKDFVDQLTEGSGGGTAEKLTEEEFQKELSRLLTNGQAIPAIKLYRNQFGVGLKEAKQQVEAIAKEMGVPFQAGAGCAGMIVFMAGIGGAGAVVANALLS